MSPSKSILKVLSSPSKLASVLDRTTHGSVLTLDIKRHRIGMAVVPREQQDTHGSSTLTKEALPLAAISTSQRSITTECVEQLHRVVEEHNVCGFVVSWPIQRDTGKIGAPCGRVLFTLESILELSDDNILTPNRTLCLWDSLHRRGAFHEQGVEDEWGRCSLYTRTSNKTEHLASTEQYTPDQSIDASQVWDDFSRAHWPELYYDDGSKVKMTTGLSAWKNLVADSRDCRPSMAQAAAG